LFEQHLGLVVKLVRTPTEEAFLQAPRELRRSKSKIVRSSFSFSVAMTLSMRVPATCGRWGWATRSGKMTMRRRRFLLNRAHHRDLVVNLILLDCCRYNELNATFKNVKGLGDDGTKG
jgi:hypothetical protein